MCLTEADLPHLAWQRSSHNEAEGLKTILLIFLCFVLSSNLTEHLLCYKMHLPLIIVTPTNIPERRKNPTGDGIKKKKAGKNATDARKVGNYSSDEIHFLSD